MELGLLGAAAGCKDSSVPEQRGTGPGLLAQKGRVQPAAELKPMPNVMLRFAETMASFCAGLGE